MVSLEANERGILEEVCGAWLGSSEIRQGGEDVLYCGSITKQNWVSIMVADDTGSAFKLLCLAMSYYVSYSTHSVEIHKYLI